MLYIFSSPIELVSEFDPRLHKISFLGIIISYTGLIVKEAWSYPPDARLMPFGVGIVLLIMISAEIVLILSHGNDVKMSNGAGNVTKLRPDQPEENHDIKNDDQGDIKVRYITELQTMLWVGSFFILIWLIGFLYATGTFITLIIYKKENDLFHAIAAAVLTISFIYLLFIKLLSVPLYTGILEIMKGIP